MDGFPALDLWDLVIEVFHSKSNQTHRNQQARGSRCMTKRPEKRTNSQNKTPVSKESLELSNIEFVSSSVNSSHQGAKLYIFEDNKTVIKMIIEGRSLTMRHVSRTRRVALDWLFDRINLDSQIQVKHADSKNQLADILTKGNFTRDEWNHFLSLFNISLFSWDTYIFHASMVTTQDTTRSHSTSSNPHVHKSWRSDAPIILP